MAPVLFHVMNMPIRSYGLMMAVAFLVGIWIARRRSPERGFDPNMVVDLSVFVILASVAGARAGYVLVRWDHFAGDPMSVFRLWEGGLALYGGMLTGTAAGLLFFRNRGIDIWRGSDLLIPSIAIGVAVGRVGCFLNGCCFGEACDLPWGVVFGEGSAAGHQFPGIHVHPTQIYEALIALAVFFVILIVEKRKPFDGFLLWLFVILLAVSRFIIDPLRYYEPVSFQIRSGSIALTNNQLVGILLVLLSTGFMIVLSRRKRRTVM